MNKTDFTSGILQSSFFYVIWADDLLSASEIDVVKRAILEDISLSAMDRETLLSWLDKKTPPIG